MKYEISITGELIANEAAQIFGGRAITKSGMGKFVEKVMRGYKFHAILGGSQEIMQELGVTMGLKTFDSDAKL